jgi:predicted MFS family arabinose efflux permease
MPYAVSVAGWFDRNRGLALGLVNTGAGVGAALAPQYANFLVTTYGWRVGFLGVALVAGLVPLVGLAFLVREPPVAAAAKSTASAPLRHDYLHNRHFWLIAIGILGVSVALFGVMGSMVPMLTDRGVSGGTVAAALSVAGASSWVGRIAVGFAMDKVFAPYVATFSFALALVGVGLVAFTQATPPLILGAALIGITFGAEGDLVTYLASRYFGMGIYSRVLGALWVTWAWGGGIGTYLVGVSFSATRSYEFALTIFAAVLIASSIAVLMLGPYVNPPERSRGATNAILAA